MNSDYFAKRCLNNYSMKHALYVHIERLLSESGYPGARRQLNIADIIGQQCNDHSHWDNSYELY